MIFLYGLNSCARLKGGRFGKVGEVEPMLDTSRIPLTGNALAWYRQGLSHAIAGEHQTAVSYYNQVLQSRSEFWEAWYERGLSLYYLRQFIDSIASFDHSLASNPVPEAFTNIWHDRGNVLQYGLSRYEEAIANYADALHHDESNAVAWYDQGNALFYGLDQCEGAIASYDRALALKADATTWRSRGIVLFKLQRYEEALTSYDRALALQPNDASIWQARREAAEHLGLNPLQAPTHPTCQCKLAVELEASKILDTSTENYYQHPVLVIEDDSGQREVTLDEERYTIGRDPRNDIHLRSQFVSRFHALLIQLEVGIYKIVDGDSQGKPSTNGILINGQRQHSHDLQTGDSIIFGPQARATYRRLSRN
jgi:tetratricopeptide (TPR) repeat protein